MRRLRLIRIGFLSISILFFLRLFYIQVLQYSYYRERAKRNFIRSIRIQGPRGRILDRNGQVLADWIPGFRMNLLTDSINRRAVALLDTLLGVERVQTFLEKLREGYLIPMDLDLEEAVSLEERMDRLPGLVITGTPRRFYTSPRSLSHLLGYTGQVTIEDLRSNNHFMPGDVKGKYGIEKLMDDSLRGKAGTRFLAVDASGRIVSMDPRPPIAPKAGKDIRLTIERELQEFIDSIFPKGYKGAVVVLDARTGEILALYSAPTFDSNQLSWGMPPPLWKKMSRDTMRPFLNRALSGRYPPGSIIKPVVGLIGLSLKKPRWFKPCLGQFKYGNRIWRCWLPTGHGSLNLIHAIEQSCDIYFYQLGLSIGLDHLLEKMGEIFEVIRSDLRLPEERHSFIPTLDWYRDRYGKTGYGPGIALNLSIGQGEILMTPLEIAYLTALIAKDSLPSPWVIKEIDGRPVPPPPPRTLGFDKKFLKVIRRAMREVVEGKHGTGKAARIDGIVVAGKTGTAQNIHGEDHSLFTSFAPYQDPKVVVTVIVENAGHGSDVAAPLAGKILAYIFGGGV